MELCEETYYSNKLDKADNEETWPVLNKTLTKKNTVYAINLKTILMANIYIKFQDIANGFKKYPTDIGPSSSSKIPVGKGNIYDHMQKKSKIQYF